MTHGQVTSDLNRVFMNSAIYENKLLLEWPCLCSTKEETNIPI